MKSLLISVAVVVIAVIVAFVVMATQSRSGHTPGLVDGNLQSCGNKPNCVSSMAPASSERHVPGFQFEAGNADEVWADLTGVIVELGGTLVDNAPPYLAAEFSSETFGFIDDVECLINNQSGVVHIRSSSRVGYSDLDVNRKRVEAIRARLAIARQE